MKYLWIFLILSASAFGQNSYGADYLNLHCTAPDPSAPPNFGDTPKPGLVPTSAATGNAVLYCDASSSTIKVSFSGGAYGGLGGAGFPGSGSNPFVATSTLQLPAGTSGAPALQLGGAVDGFYQFGSHQIGMVSNGFVSGNINSSDGMNLNTGTFLGWCASPQVGTCTDGAVTLSVPIVNNTGALSILQVGSGSASATTGKVKAAGYISAGTTFTSSGGCTEGSLTGGATAGKFTTSGSTSCTTTITMGNTATAPNGWQCSATDLTTSADAGNPHMTTSNTTTATIATGTIVSGDVISFSCTGY